MNKDAKIGLFAVLILVVLVVVMWAKLAGNDKEDATLAAGNTITSTTDGQATTNTGMSGAERLLLSSNTTAGGNTAPGATGLNSSSTTGNSTSETSGILPSGNTSSSGPGTSGISPADSGTKDISFAGESAKKPAGFSTDESSVLGSGDSKSLGNTDSTSTLGASDWPKEHVVAARETLIAIARKYHTSSQAIADANKDIISDPARIRAGMKIKIPEPAGKDTLVKIGDRKDLDRETSKTSADKASSTPKPGSKYIVKQHDTLMSISRAAYGRPNEWQAIFKANKDKLASPERLSTGTVLILPEKK